MYTRSDSVTMSVQTNYPEHVAYPRAMATRSTLPEIFTFERIPTQATAVRSYGPLRSKKRCTRVMYPAKVHMHLPPVEKSAAKRWLLALCLVLLWQIYTEEPCTDTPLGTADSPAADFQILPFQSAEEQVRQLTEVDGFSSLQLPSGEKGSSPWFNILSNSSSSSASSARGYDQSTRNGYMVALLVYHKFGSDN
ncbi:unnamed protein product [Lota lota]